MIKKYELLPKESNALHRIRALRDFGNVKAGELGGCIESEKNLSHEGTCWVYPNAKVYDDARVFDNATIYGKARVYDMAAVADNAKVYGRANVAGKAMVFGNAQVFGKVWVTGNAVVTGNAKVFGDIHIESQAKVTGDALCSQPVFTCEFLKYRITVTDKHVTIGCEHHTFKHWIKHVEKIGRKHKYTEHEIKLYKLIIFSMIEARTGKQLIKVGE